MEIAGQDAELPEIRRRSRYFALVALVAFLAIAGRLFYLQVIQGDTFFRVTSDSIVHTELLPAVRGQIRDRKGKVLATVRPSYNVYVTPRLLTAEGFARLRALLGMNGDEAIDVWERVQNGGADGAGGPHAAERPVLLAEDISREAMAAIETGVDLPGVKIVSGPRRSYPQGALAAHVARLHERDLGRRAARQEGRGLPRGRSHRPHRDRAAVGRLPARARRLPEDRRRPARPAQDRHPRRHRRAGGAAGRGREQRGAHDRRRRPALHRAGAAQRLGGGRGGARRQQRAASWRWPPSRASIPTRCRGT